MKSKFISSAFFRFRNVAVLILCLAAIGSVNSGAVDIQRDLGINTSSLPIIEVWQALLASLGVYGALVVQTLLSKSYNETFVKKQKIKNIRGLNNTCVQLAQEARKHTNATYFQKLKKVADDKNEILNSFLRGEQSYLKEKIVEQTLNLVVTYIKLLTNFCIRSRELSEIDVSEITNRINANTRKLSFTKDPNAADDIKNIVEIDQKIIERLKDEKRDLERISAKLDYMESMVHMFKHQIISSIESEEMVEKLETAINEANALDGVLEERRKSSRVRT